jgi:hypothetical protein
MLADQFTQIFRGEHRKVRDALLDLIQAIGNRDRASVQSLLQQIAVYTGPHFRYEEEAMYPALVEIFGEEYVQKLLEDHDRAIGTAQRLVELAGKETFTDEDVNEAIRLTRTILPHVSDCDGLSIMVERLPSQTVQHILDTRASSLDENLDLLSWATTVRSRPIITPG